MPRDVLGLDPYQRGAISCARVGCVAALLSLIAGVAVYLYEAFLPSDSSLLGGSGSLVAGALVIGSVVMLILARLRLSKEVRT